MGRRYPRAYRCRRSCDTGRPGGACWRGRPSIPAVSGTLPSALFESGSVAAVSGLAGMVTGLVTIAATYTIGAVTDQYSFTPILLGSSAAPVLATIAVFALVRNTRHTGNGVLLKI